MNIGALTQAMKEKEMINLITNLMKYREKHGKESFKAVLEQMEAILDLNKQSLALTEEQIKEAALKGG